MLSIHVNFNRHLQLSTPCSWNIWWDLSDGAAYGITDFDANVPANYGKMNILVFLLIFITRQLCDFFNQIINCDSTLVCFGDFIQAMVAPERGPLQLFLLVLCFIVSS